MEKAMIRNHLVRAEEHVQHGLTHYAELRGADTALALDVLTTFGTLPAHVVDGDRLARNWRSRNNPMEPPAEYAAEMRIFTTDEQGRRVLRRLTVEETDWYLERNDPKRNRDPVLIHVKPLRRIASPFVASVQRRAVPQRTHLLTGQRQCRRQERRYRDRLGTLYRYPGGVGGDCRGARQEQSIGVMATI
jgi:hypothetical protein